ncbi:MAG: 5-methyltetrahydropteroyltriglutamate--homocysteine S-methyltransferase [Cyanobacteria bacterium SBC]|nr:5-methyltetrahydropteroyltriglutamate--homocysteine S-methyltransferase [Cyanobacteria bacterium SBC]
MLTTTFGYPCIGKKRELKKSLESFWKGKLSEIDLLATLHTLQNESWTAQLDAGIEGIGVGDATLYDRVLDWVVRFGLIPQRFRSLSGLDRYFAMARGKDAIAALEMTKWFDTNYHYLVPEVTPDVTPTANFDNFIDTVRRAKSALGERAIPIVLGPVTLLRLSRLDGVEFNAILSQLIPLYRQLLSELQELGIAEVQLHEPALVFSDASELQGAFEMTYRELDRVGVPLHLVTYFDDLGQNYTWVANLPVAAIALDFTRGQNLELVKIHGFPKNKRLGAGVVDARNVWRVRPETVTDLLRQLQAVTIDLCVHPSASLQFVPYDAARETQLPEPLRNVLSFAEQKLEEVVSLGEMAAHRTASSRLDRIEKNWAAFRLFCPAKPEVQQRIESLKVDDFERSQPYSDRVSQQVKLPPFPTTTIGSYPQTQAVRKLRARYKRGELTLEAYQQQIDFYIAYCIGVQDGMGMDVLVHGEFERSDMVEYFGEQLEGYAFTRQGWVQSYGSRYVRPPIIFGDIDRPHAMTVREFQVAQSLTEKPVKGMLTGPVTMLNWSYPRTDISRKEQALQLALAIRDEVADLEAAGARFVQVDEPALREGLPLKQERWNEYLSWAVDAFRLSVGVARPQTQVHTHMCYSEFGDIMDAINRLDADAISIEDSRSNNATLLQLTDADYPRQVGPGVYDVHAPAVPTKEMFKDSICKCSQHLPIDRVWVNPDCGLKTRGWQETVAATRNMVSAALELRRELNASSNGQQ